MFNAPQSGHASGGQAHLQIRFPHPEHGECTIPSVLHSGHAGSPQIHWHCNLLHAAHIGHAPFELLHPGHVVHAHWHIWLPQIPVQIVCITPCVPQPGHLQVHWHSRLLHELHLGHVVVLLQSGQQVHWHSKLPQKLLSHKGHYPPYLPQPEHLHLHWHAN